MSEQLRNIEAEQSHEAHHAPPETAKTPEIDKEKLEAESRQLLEQSRQDLEQIASPSEKFKIEDNDADTRFHFGSHSALKKDTYTQLLKEIRQKLPKKHRKFSRVIHQKNIETISNLSAQTIARPSGLLGGGIAALLGSIILARYSYYYGFSYSYSFILLAFAAGFLAGVLVEFILKLFKKKA